MGNHTGKDGHGATGSPLDFFHTPATTPSQPETIAMALSTAAACSRIQTLSPACSITPLTPSPVAEWLQKQPPPAEWALMSPDSVAVSETKAAVGIREAVASPPSLESWQERDSGLEPQAAEEGAGEQTPLGLLRLMERYRASVELSPHTDATTGAELLGHLIAQKDELVEEVDTLREMLRRERLEWQQFQSDLQVAVSVADRLRIESEQALAQLQENHRALEHQLAQALHRQEEKDRQLESLRAELRDVSVKLAKVTQQQQQQQERAKLVALKDSLKDVGDRQTEGRERVEGEEKPEAANGEKRNDRSDASEEADDDVLEGEGAERGQLMGRGVAEGYLRSLAALERKKERQKTPRRIVKLSERSWSLSRLPLSTEPPGLTETSTKTSTTFPLCKKEEQVKQETAERLLQRQDSWSSFSTGKRDEDLNSNPTKPQDGFSALLRRHGGSRRNSLLRWCQSRTQGYENIEITNFSSSWEDGLAFCAVYHTYLPDLIPYDILNPVDKKDNLNLAFKTGESVGIPATLSVEEMLKACGPDWQSVLAYVESIFRHFEM
ncbi:cytospin-A-like [Takifugu flavidus]|uniref:cytospin-A-like n=1 Tax=Takifugu flavidus TaxID=433684 RepID=UPI0025443A5D|nr:cytospin-A-like [Takifugu flavidus]XP_056872427.1 cytospin-A-like [Takifugu flavidus]